MRWTFFHRRESNLHDVRSKPCVPYELELDPGATLEDALEAAYEDGMPHGSSRAGCVEIQNDLGIYTQIHSMRIDPSKPQDVIFKTWQQLMEEDR